MQDMILDSAEPLKIVFTSVEVPNKSRNRPADHVSDYLDRHRKQRAHVQRDVFLALVQSKSSSSGSVRV
jgi:hypothetical protein